MAVACRSAFLNILDLIWRVCVCWCDLEFGVGR